MTHQTHIKVLWSKLYEKRRLPLRANYHVQFVIYNYKNVHLVFVYITHVLLVQHAESTTKSMMRCNKCQQCTTRPGSTSGLCPPYQKKMFSKKKAVFISSGLNTMLCLIRTWVWLQLNKSHSLMQEQPLWMAWGIWDCHTAHLRPENIKMTQNVCMPHSVMSFQYFKSSGVKTHLRVWVFLPTAHAQHCRRTWNKTNKQNLKWGETQDVGVQGETS